MRLILFLCLFILVTKHAFGFDRLLFKPLIANVFEPRVGSFYQFDDKKLRLDIGTSIDLLELYNSDSSKIRFGTDFMTYTRLRAESNFKFPVETSDYFFGINFSHYSLLENIPFHSRVRLAHISSHMVDGFTDEDWVFSESPFVYSREFIEFVGTLTFGGFRPYCGVNFVFSTKPKNVTPVVPQLGFDFQDEIFGNIDLVGGFDYKLVGIDSKYISQSSSQIGLLLRTHGDIGVLISGYYYGGRSIHGMFYKEIDNYLGLGFQVIFH